MKLRQWRTYSPVEYKVEDKITYKKYQALLGNMDTGENTIEFHWVIHGLFGETISATKQEINFEGDKYYEKQFKGIIG